MRYLIFLLLTTTTLFAQTEATSSDKYVWAKSGLTLRAEGNPKGKKLAVIPYGATVQLTGEWGGDLSIEVIHECDIGGTKMPNWEMPGRFIGVRYGGLKGFAFSGYINNYNPVTFSMDSLNGVMNLGKMPVKTLHFLSPPPEHEYGESSVLYPNGVTSSSYWNKAGGGGTIVVPNADLAAGYLLAVKLFGLDHQYTDHQPGENPHLYAKTVDSLSFRHEQLEVTIKEYFGVVIIIYDAHC